MLNPDVFCRDVTIFVKIFVPYNALKGNNSKKLTGLEIFLNPYVPVGMSSKYHRPGRIHPILYNFKIIKSMLNPDVFCRDTTIFVKIFVPYNAFKRNNSKKLAGLEIFLNPHVPVGNSSKFHRHCRIVPIFLKL
jgi:hypothetical protein